MRAAINNNKKNNSEYNNNNYNNNEFNQAWFLPICLAPLWGI